MKDDGWHIRCPQRLNSWWITNPIRPVSDKEVWAVDTLSPERADWVPANSSDAWQVKRLKRYDE